jgi:hypothetical protein
LILDDLKKILDRGYVVAPTTTEFKDSNIHLVYSGTSCGLNDALWEPNFWLPTPATAARSISYGCYMVDIDLGEMFLNFPLHKILQKFPGVNFSHYAADLNAECPNN